VAWDSGIFKNTAITERIRSSFRVEFFNLPNRANFNAPASNVSVPAAAGRITVLDRPGVEARACECYAVVKKEFDRLLPDEMKS